MSLRLLPLVSALAVAAFATRSLAIATHEERTPPVDSLEAQLTNLERQSWVAWKARDGGFFQNFLSDDHVETGAAGLAGKTDVVGFVGSPMCVVERYSLDRFHLTRFDENTALLSYHASQSTTCNGARVPSPVWVSSLFLRRDGRWLNALYQQTPASE